VSPGSASVNLIYLRLMFTDPAGGAPLTPPRPFMFLRQLDELPYKWLESESW